MRVHNNLWHNRHARHINKKLAINPLPLAAVLLAGRAYARSRHRGTNHVTATGRRVPATPDLYHQHTVTSSKHGATTQYQPMDSLPVVATFLIQASSYLSPGRGASIFLPPEIYQMAPPRAHALRLPHYGFSHPFADFSAAQPTAGYR
jgi:hypothetical protein